MHAAATLLAGAIFMAGQADIASSGGIHIGSSFVPWGGTVVLDEQDALIRANGRCAFKFSYEVANNGKEAAGPFKNFLTTTTPLNTVAIIATESLGPGETRQLATQSFLVPGSYGLILKLDAENVLAEANESNNGYFINISLKGQCQGPPLR